MCTSGSNGSTTLSPEQRISQLVSEEAGIYINPQVIKLIIKYRWAEIAKAAHEIHGSAQ